MKVEQFVMAYEAEQDRLRALLPEGFTSLRPVLRLNGEIWNGDTPYLELNTPVEGQGKRGWINVAHWEADSGLTFTREGKSVTFRLPFLTITYTPVGAEGGCPAEKDNDGCFFPGEAFRPAESITVNKEFCDCRFRWDFPKGKAGGESTGVTLPAYPTEPKIQYPRGELNAESAAAIPCNQVLGSYMVVFERE
ncbi:MAG: hypothetical protein IJO37_09705 [Ruminiclostridium sp.]|nr:hypothetical protein [Ruminiclostridium sp.]